MLFCKKSKKETAALKKEVESLKKENQHLAEENETLRSAYDKERAMRELDGKRHNQETKSLKNTIEDLTIAMEKMTDRNQNGQFVADDGYNKKTRPKNSEVEA